MSEPMSESQPEPPPSDPLRNVRQLRGRLKAPPGAEASIAIVAARFNDYITGHMLHAAVEAFEQCGGRRQQLTVAHVPGSLELAVTARKLAQTGRYAAIVCLGCVIRGDTDHFEHVCEQTAKGIREVGTQTGVPCIFGVLTCDTVEQALQRAGIKMGNHGRSAMLAALEMADLLQQVGEA